MVRSAKYEPGFVCNFALMFSLLALLIKAEQQKFGK